MPHRVHRIIYTMLVDEHVKDRWTVNVCLGAFILVALSRNGQVLHEGLPHGCVPGVDCVCAVLLCSLERTSMSRIF